MQNQLDGLGFLWMSVRVKFRSWGFINEDNDESRFWEFDGELFQNMNTRVPSEPILLLTPEFENFHSIKWMKKTYLNN